MLGNYNQYFSIMIEVTIVLLNVLTVIVSMGKINEMEN